MFVNIFILINISKYTYVIRREKYKWLIRLLKTTK